MIFQHFNLLNAKTVAANVDWPLKITGKYSRHERAARVDELLELVGLSAHRDKYPAQLSGGHKQKGQRHRDYQPDNFYVNAQSESR